MLDWEGEKKVAEKITKGISERGIWAVVNIA